jgi:cell division protein FtsB
MSVSRQSDLLQQEITRLSEKNDQLAGEIRRLRSDRRYIEDIARRDLRMAKENEIIYIFPPQGQSAGQDGAALPRSGSSP